MSELTPKEPKTPEEKRARAHKIRTMVLDMFLPVLAALFLILAVIWPNSIMASLAGIFAGAVLIRFSGRKYTAIYLRRIQIFHHSPQSHPFDILGVIHSIQYQSMISSRFGKSYPNNIFIAIHDNQRPSIHSQTFHDHLKIFPFMLHATRT